MLADQMQELKRSEPPKAFMQFQTEEKGTGYRTREMGAATVLPVKTEGKLRGLTP